MPSGDSQNATTSNTTTEYIGTFTTFTDAAGMKRRTKFDPLDRMVRLDEPDDSGDIGSAESPTRYTSYQYDVLDNLLHITQGSQERFFKYDSLSRLTYDRQVEQNAPWTTDDSVAGKQSLVAKNHLQLAWSG